jgi:hypothetical protein
MLPVSDKEVLRSAARMGRGPERQRRAHVCIEHMRRQETRAISNTAETLQRAFLTDFGSLEAQSDISLNILENSNSVMAHAILGFHISGNSFIRKPKSLSAAPCSHQICSASITNMK